MSSTGTESSHPHVVTTPSEREIRVERIFRAGRERVWEALTEPDLLAQWWGRGHRLDVEAFELEPGGRWRFVEHAPEGTFGFEGRFREVTPRERIVLTFGWDGMPGHEIVETMTLEDLDDGRTRLVTVAVFSAREDRDGMIAAGMEEGMAQSYRALDAVLASLS